MPRLRRDDVEPGVAARAPGEGTRALDAAALVVNRAGTIVDVRALHGQHREEGRESN